MTQAMSQKNQHAKKNSMNQQTSPRHMLFTQAGGAPSQETDSSRRYPIYVQSSQGRSSNDTRSRGRRAFDKSSYKDSFPIRCTDPEKLNSQAKQEIEQR